VGSSSRGSSRATVDFPDPDSPTRPSVRPRDGRHRLIPRHGTGGDRVEQRPCVGVAGRAQDLLDRALLHHLARVHDDDAVGHLRPVGAERPRDLVADGEERIERAHRVLEHHCDLGAAQRPHPVRRGADELLPAPDDRAAGHAAGPEQTQHGERGHALAGARLTDDRDGLARVHVEGHPGDRLDRPGRVVEPHAQVVHFQQRR